MINSVVLEVAIGLVYVFLLFSLLATWIQELIAFFLGLRYKHTINVIQNMLDPNVEKLDGVKRFQEKWDEGVTKSDLDKINNNFLLALYDHPVIASLSQPNKLPSYIACTDFSKAMLDLLMSAGTDETSLPEDYLGRIETGIGGIQNDRVKRTLSTLLTDVKAVETKAEKRIALFRTNMESWFNSTFARASGWYKRQATYIAIAIGMVLALTLNIDTIGLARTLWQDATLRGYLNDAAVAYVEKGEENTPGAAEVREELESLDLPLGWSMQTVSDDNDPRDFPNNAGTWFLKVFGILISGYAISQGSPLWYDFLNRLVNMRMSGKKPV